MCGQQRVCGWFFYKGHARACSCVDGSKLAGEQGELLIFVKRTSPSRASNKDEMPVLVGCSRSWNQEPPGFDPAARGGPIVMATSWLRPPLPTLGLPFPRPPSRLDVCILGACCCLSPELGP